MCCQSPVPGHVGQPSQLRSRVSQTGRADQVLSHMNDDQRASPCVRRQENDDSIAIADESSYGTETILVQ
jgi:hypothetical protein